MRKLRVLPLLGLVLLGTGCGLPDSYYLQPPVLSSAASTLTPSFTFSNPIHDLNHDINVNFTGVEIYYKIYGNSSVEVNAYEPSNSTDASVQLSSKGFYPVCLASDSAPVSRTDPPIAVDSALAASGSNVTVNVNQVPSPNQNSAFFTLATNPPVEFRRAVVDQSGVPPLNGQYKSFQSGVAPPGQSYLQTDADFSSAYAAYLSAGSPGVIYLAWYAMSFGYTTSGTPVRSQAVYMGEMQFPYP